MKKTFITIAILALAAASSQAAVLSTTTFVRVDGDWTNLEVNTDSNAGLISPDRPAWWGSKPWGDPDNSLDNNSSLPTSIVSAPVVVGGTNAQGSNYWSIDIDFVNYGSQDVQIDSVDLTMIGYDSYHMPLSGTRGIANNGYVGGFDGDYNKPVNVSLTWLNENGSSVYTDTLAFNASTVASGDPDAGSWDGTHTGTYNLGSSSFTLNPMERARLRVQVSRNDDNLSVRDGDFYMGLKQIVIKEGVVPEPATASLSLLGLAALMMRRRRA